MLPIKCNLLSTSKKIRQNNHSTPVHMHDKFCNMLGAFFFLICSYTPREDVVKMHWARRARCVHTVDAQWQLHATSTPWALHDHTVNRQSELRGSTVARCGRSPETPLSPRVRRDISTLWKMLNYSLYFRAIPQHSEKFQIAAPTPWDRSRVWQELANVDQDVWGQN